MSHKVLRTAFATSCAALPLLAAVSATAAPHRTPIKAEKTYSTTLQAATGDRTVRTLDWRTPSVDLRFDLSQADIINDLAVTISADPLPGVDPSLPLTVQFNGAKPVRVKTQGRGFDAVVKLDRSRVRATGNTLRLSHAVPCGTREGGYTVSLDESRISVRARPKSRRLQLREVESRLSGSAFAPDTVGLIASGPMATRLQSLGAQAVGLRMDVVPNFRTTLTGTDFDIVMVTRDELYRYTDEADILTGTGPRIELPRAYPDRILLTGDTEAELLQTVQAFSTHFLPGSRRSTTSPGELRVQSPLDYTRTRVHGQVRLDSLSVKTGSMREYTFDVSDPAATDGELLLRLTRDTTTAPGAKLKAVLNGESLGEATLDARRKTVSYPIKAGQLRGSENRLELTTKGAKDQDACTGTQPFIAVGAGSTLNLSADRPSVATDLSRFAADGSVFGANFGANTEVILPSGAGDYNAALKVVARLGRASGQGWTDAGFHRGEAPATTAHILSIEPYNQIASEVRGAAPRGLLSAWRGQVMDGENRLASVERFASLDAEEAVRLASRRLRASGRINAGGVAAVYPGEAGQLYGVISNTPGRGFANSLAPLSTDAHWNGMSGGVSRWNADAIVMAQAALPAPGVAPAPSGEPELSIWNRFVSLDMDRFALPEFDLPEFDLSDMSAPSVDLSGVKARLASWTERKPEAPDTATFETPSFETPNFELAPVAAPIVVKPTPAPKAAPVVRVAEAAPVPVSAPAPRVKPRTVRTEAPASRKLEVPTITPPKLRGSIDLSAPRHNARSKQRGFSNWMRSSLREKQRSFRSGLRSLEVKASRTRAQLRNRTGLRRPNVSGVRVGGYEIAPPMIALILATVLTLIGLFFINSRPADGNHH